MFVRSIDTNIREKMKTKLSFVLSTFPRQCPYRRAPILSFVFIPVLILATASRRLAQIRAANDDRSRSREPWSSRAAVIGGR